jgi:hypothetical protein
MDKKAKKKLDALHTRLQNLQKQVAGAKKQRDEPDELRRLEQQVADTEREIEKLKSQ